MVEANKSRIIPFNTLYISSITYYMASSISKTVLKNVHHLKSWFLLSNHSFIV